MLALSSEEGWQCTVCAKVGKRKDIMRDHIESYHLGHAGHICGICGNSYKTKNSLMKHRSTYHKVVVWCSNKREEKMAVFYWQQIFSCLLLTPSILDIEALVQSYMKKTVDSDCSYVWQCIECGKTSRVSTNLKDHIEANHLGNLQIECNMCAKMFKSRGSLRAHVRSSHKHMPQ